jgi:hypothetical protein
MPRGCNTVLSDGGEGDVMVFDQEFHWWSLHELTSGTMTWTS